MDLLRSAWGFMPFRVRTTVRNIAQLIHAKLRHGYRRHAACPASDELGHDPLAGLVSEHQP